MGRFSRSPAVDNDLVKLLIAEDSARRRDSKRALAKSQHAIPTLLEEGEAVLAIAHKERFSSEVILLTDRRLISLKEGKTQWDPVGLYDVAGASILAVPRDMDIEYAVHIKTDWRKLYKRGVQRRYDRPWCIDLLFNDLRDARAWCAIVDRMVKCSRA